MDIEHFATFEAEMIERGLHPGAPSAEAYEIDAPIVERDPCPDCGGRVTFEAYSAPRGVGLFGKPRYEYHAFGVCRACDAAFEF